MALKVAALASSIRLGSSGHPRLPLIYAPSPRQVPLNRGRKNRASRWTLIGDHPNTLKSWPGATRTRFDSPAARVALCHSASTFVPSSFPLASITSFLPNTIPQLAFASTQILPRPTSITLVCVALLLRYALPFGNWEGQRVFLNICQLAPETSRRLVQQHCKPFLSLLRSNRLFHISSTVICNDSSHLSRTSWTASTRRLTRFVD